MGTKRYRVYWDDYEDGCGHDAVFQADGLEDPWAAARRFLDGLGALSSYGYSVEFVVDLESGDKFYGLRANSSDTGAHGV